jgi:hypothetical protein
MRRLALLLALATPVLLNAQSQTTTPCPTTATLDQLISALDDAVSGPADKDRTCFRQIMLPDARLIPVSTPSGSTTPAHHILTTDDWIAAVRKRGTTPFYEVQVKYSSETFGHIAHLWSTYETRPTPDGKPIARGINSIQAVFDGQQWKILEILWQTENATDQIPAQYLP